MAADFNTSIRMSGTKEEIIAMLTVAKKYATEKQQQYREKRDCEYFLGVAVKAANGNIFDFGRSLTEMSDAELSALIDDSNCAVCAEASGPYGVFGTLDEIFVFEEMAEAAPNAKFVAEIDGFNPGGSQSALFVLENKLLNIKSYSEGEDFDYEESDEDEEDWDDEGEPEWTYEACYDPIAKKYIED